MSSKKSEEVPKSLTVMVSCAVDTAQISTRSIRFPKGLVKKLLNLVWKVEVYSSLFC